MTESPARYAVTTDERPAPQYARCDVCGKPIAEVTDAGLLIRVRHGNDHHVTLLTWPEVLAWAWKRAA